MTLLPICPAANANLSADDCVRLVGRAGLAVMTGRGLAAVQHAESTDGSATAQAGPCGCRREPVNPHPVHHALPDALHDALQDSTGSAAAVLQWLRVFAEEKADCLAGGRVANAPRRRSG